MQEHGADTTVMLKAVANMVKDGDDQKLLGYFACEEHGEILP